MSARRSNRPPPILGRGTRRHATWRCRAAGIPKHCRWQHDGVRWSERRKARRAESAAASRKASTMSALLQQDVPTKLAPAGEPLVRLRDLSVRFVSRDATMHAVNGVDLDLSAGEVLCILGESGSGKSVTMRALMKLLPKSAVVTGEIRVAGNDVQRMSENQLQEFRGSTVAMVFQEPMTALDPVYSVGRQIAETVQRHEGVS